MSLTFLQAEFSTGTIQLLIAIVLLIIGIFIGGYFYFMKKRERETCNQLIEKKELEKNIGIMQAKQEERARISADLHDDLGSGLTSIRLYSELAVERPGSGQMPEVQRISSLSNELINSMNAIIWTMDMANDTLSNLLVYLRKIAIDYFEATNIRLEVNISEDVPEIELSGQKRRSIYLVVKEILANIVKHSSANEVMINMLYANKLLITIKDNGTGFKESSNKRQGSGIKNIHRRLHELGGNVTIEDKDGVSVALEIPLLPGN